MSQTLSEIHWNQKNIIHKIQWITDQTFDTTNTITVNEFLTLKLIPVPQSSSFLNLTKKETLVVMHLDPQDSSLFCEDNITIKYDSSIWHWGKVETFIHRGITDKITGNDHNYFRIMVNLLSVDDRQCLIDLIKLWNNMFYKQITDYNLILRLNAKLLTKQFIQTVNASSKVNLKNIINKYLTNFAMTHFQMETLYMLYFVINKKKEANIDIQQVYSICQANNVATFSKMFPEIADYVNAGININGDNRIKILCKKSDSFWIEYFDRENQKWWYIKQYNEKYNHKLQISFDNSEKLGQNLRNKGKNYPFRVDFIKINPNNNHIYYEAFNNLRPKRVKSVSEWFSLCQVCLKDDKKLKKCSGCKLVFYCGIKCQKFHWKYRHRYLCTRKYK